MTRFLRRVSSPRAPARRPRLGFDVLEPRDCPSGWDVPLPPGPTAGAPTGPDDMQTGPSPFPPFGGTNNPPRIEDFNAESIGGGMYRFTGRVIDEMTIGMYVTFSGVPSVQGQTATVGPGGQFSVTIQLQTDGSDDGTVSVVTVDNIGQRSNEPCVPVNP